MTLTARVLAYVRRHPGSTAWQISKALATHPQGSKLLEVHRQDPRFVAASASSILKRKADEGVLRRERNRRGAWTYWPAAGWKAR